MPSMRFCRLHLGVVMGFTVTLGSAAEAQTVERVVMEKGRTARQVDAAGSLDSNALPWFASPRVTGSGLEDLDPPPRLEGAIGPGEPVHNAGFLGWNSQRGEWGYAFPVFAG